jgi:hypothetical protein
MSFVQKTKHRIKRMFQKLLIRIKKMFVSEEIRVELTVPQKKAIAICINMINDKKSELLMTTLSDKRYIKNGDYFLVMGNDIIQIVNHVYGYDIPISGKYYKSIINLFDKKLDVNRLAMENEILSNVTYSLDNILKNIKNI